MQDGPPPCTLRSAGGAELAPEVVERRGDRVGAEPGSGARIARRPASNSPMSKAGLAARSARLEPEGRQADGAMGECGRTWPHMGGSRSF